MTLAANKNSTISSTDVINLRGRVTRRLTELNVKIETPVHTDVYKVAGIAVMRFRPLEGAGQKVDAITQREADIAIAAGIKPRMYLDEATNSIAAEFLIAQPPTLYTSALIESGISYGMTVGRDVQGQPLHVSIDNDATPHTLVVGTTGAGKTALCHSMIATVARATPQLKIISYDPVHTDYPWIEPYMRFKQMRMLNDSGSLLHVLNEFVARIERKEGFHHRVLIYIDELCDLIAAEPRSAMLLTRIAQMGRQYGMHLLCATQNPSRDILPAGLIKNMPARVVLAVVDRTESNMASGNVKIDAHKLPRPGAGVLVANGQAVRFIAAIPDNYKTARERGSVGAHEDAPVQEPLPITVRTLAPNRLEVQARREFALPAIASPKGETIELGPARTQTIEPVAVENVPPQVMTRPADSYTLAERIALVMAWNPSVSVSALQNALRPGGAQNGFATVTQIVNEIKAKRGEE